MTGNALPCSGSTTSSRRKPSTLLLHNRFVQLPSAPVLLPQAAPRHFQHPLLGFVAADEPGRVHEYTSGNPALLRQLLIAQSSPFRHDRQSVTRQVTLLNTILRHKEVEYRTTTHTPANTYVAMLNIFHLTQAWNLHNAKPWNRYRGFHSIRVFNSCFRFRSGLTHFTCAFYGKTYFRCEDENSENNSSYSFNLLVNNFVNFKPQGYQT